MKVISINTSDRYNVITGCGLLADCAGYIRAENGVSPDAETAVIITDNTVGALYAGTAAAALEAAGFRTLIYYVPDGEAAKSIAVYASLLEYLAENRVGRRDFIAALGGGTVGDLAGFAAASYLRRIDYIQIPTTLLAAVDSSVGGKTGINLKAGKNLAGAFYQPRLVLCDTELLETLSDEAFASGCAEVIKYGILGDERLFEHLEDFGGSFDKEYVISRCIEMKRDIVSQDEYDNGMRRFLNLGHTLGHAAEMLSGFSLMHGEAVSMGIAVVARAAAARGICSHECKDRIISLCSSMGLPTKCGFPADELFAAMETDKKRTGSDIAIVIPESIGKCRICRMSMKEMREFMESGL